MNKRQRVFTWIGHHRNAIAWLLVGLAWLYVVNDLRGTQSDLHDQQAVTRSLTLANTQTIAEIQRERSRRIVAQGTINALVCRGNNRQNAILGNLVAVTLNGGSFGDGIDPSSLDPFDRSVLQTIAKVQALSKSTPQGKHFTLVFTHSLRDLRHRADCFKLAQNPPGLAK